MRNVAGNARASSVCKKKKKTTLQHFSSLTSLTSFPNTHSVLSKCRVAISKSLNTASPSTSYSFVFFSICEQGRCRRRILNPTDVVIPNF